MTGRQGIVFTVAAVLPLLGCTRVDHSDASPRTGTRTALVADHLVISQLYVNSSDAVAPFEEDEFIELYNPTGAPVSMTGWKIADNSGSYDIPATVIAAGGFFVIAVRNATAYEDRFGKPPDATWSSTGLANAADFVQLIDDSALMVDAVVWGASPPAWWNGVGLPSLEGNQGCAFRRVNPGYEGPETPADAATEDLTAGFFDGPAGDYCNPPEPNNPCGPDTAPCDDGLLCTEDDACSGGTCGGADVQCSDSNPCTDDGCDPDFRCVHVPNTAFCDDGEPCTTSDRCSGGVCGGIVRTCNDYNLCTDDRCELGVGCVAEPNTAPCNDNNFCTYDDVCDQGQCGGTSYTCPDDGNPCTRESCDGQGGCNSATVYGAGCCTSPSQCTVSSSECISGTCNLTEHRCEYSYEASCCSRDSDCTDDNPCTVDRCDTSTGTCIPEPVPGCCRLSTECDDGHACTSDTCDSVSYRCRHSSTQCDDTSPCQGVYPCTYSYLYVSRSDASPAGVEVPVPGRRTVMVLDLSSGAVESSLGRLSLVLESTEPAPVALGFYLHADEDGDGVADRVPIAGPASVGEGGAVTFDDLTVTLPPNARTSLMVVLDAREPGQGAGLVWLLALLLLPLAPARRGGRVATAALFAGLVIACSFEPASVEQRWRGMLALPDTEHLTVTSTSASQRIVVRVVPVESKPFEVVY